MNLTWHQNIYSILVPLCTPLALMAGAWLAGWRPERD